MRYQELRAWQEAMRLTELIFKLTPLLPATERNGLASQMRRSSRSIAANIAEGYGRKSKKEFVRFLRIATGSLFELETDVELIRRMRMAPQPRLTQAQKAITSTARLLHALAEGALRPQAS